MIIPNPRLVRLGSITRGALIEAGDGQLVVPPYIQPVFVLSSPIDRVYTGGTVGFAYPLPGLQEDSFFLGAFFLQSATSVGTNQVLASLARGLWSFEVYFMASIIVTTQQPNTLVGIYLNDPLAVNNADIVEFNALQNLTMSRNRTIDVALQRDGFQLTYTIGPTANVGDRIAINVGINARRII
jgi:hypothetical protein